MKKRNMFVKIGFIILMVGLLMTVSCTKKKPKTGTEIEQQMGTQTSRQIGAEATGDTITEEELAAQQRIEEEAKAAAAIRVKEAARSKFVNADVYFNFDDATLTSDARNVLKQKVEWLRANVDVNAVIEGHCDERGTEEYNVALGQRRAQSIKTFLMNAGINGSRLQTISYGEERPVDPASNETAWARNRRGHFRIE
ncbi:MAG: peptidoglycan-associated lipoprotein Pal [Dissulfuribacterales bacterium]